MKNPLTIKEDILVKCDQETQGRIEIPDSVTVIDRQAFKDCTGLTSIEIPSSVTKIGEWAFEGCTGLTGIEISNIVKKIGRLPSKAAQDSRASRSPTA